MKHLKLLSLLALFAFNASAQNVGIGTPTPLAPLHVSGPATEKLRLENTTALNLAIRNDLYFKTGTYFTGGIKTIGSAGNAARLGFFTYADPNSANLVERVSILDAGNVGIGTVSPTAKLEVNGTMKITDGTQGDKKVLTSDAAGNATWKSQAYGNTERFQYQVDWNGANAFPATNYNYGTATITYSSAFNKITITINKSGLYHLDLHGEGLYLGNYSVSSANPRFLELYVGNNIQKVFEINTPYAYLSSPTYPYSTAQIDKVYEKYFVAGEIFEFSVSNQGSTRTYDCDILVTGHLISE